jgi:hypothetical protein
MLCFDSLKRKIKKLLRLKLFRHKTSHMVLSIIFLEDKHKIVLHLSIFYEYQQFFQHRIRFSIQPQLQLVNLHRNRRYFVIKLHTWFCLSYFLKTSITFYCIYQYFMSINSFFNTLKEFQKLNDINRDSKIQIHIKNKLLETLFIKQHY